MTKTIICVVGTRPEAIKMAPVILALQADPDFKCKVLATAQHRQMLDQMLATYNIKPDIDLDIMQPNQGLAELTGRLLIRLDDVVSKERPDAILAQGDTTTVLSSAFVSFYSGIPFGHVEAGLRTGNIRNPFPEEMNRVVTSNLTRWHFAPTDMAAARLREEGYQSDQIIVTGNTVIDSLYHVVDTQPALGLDIDPEKRLLLVTLHRRENFGAPLDQICKALVNIVNDHPDTQVVLPVHHNPNVGKVVRERFKGMDRVILCDPLNYTSFVAAMQRAYLILSDSGGVQEEAPALGKPVLVLRETTERPEAVEAGVTRLVGTKAETIQQAAHELLTNADAYSNMVRNVSPYGDGKAALRILNILRKDLIS